VAKERRGDARLREAAVHERNSISGREERERGRGRKKIRREHDTWSSLAV